MIIEVRRIVTPLYTYLKLDLEAAWLVDREHLAPEFQQVLSSTYYYRATDEFVTALETAAKQFNCVVRQIPEPIPYFHDQNWQKANGLEVFDGTF